MTTFKVLTLTTLMLVAHVACALTAGITVNQGVAPCGQARGSLQGYGSGGIPPYTYSWSNGATTGLIEDLPAGTYTITVTDNVGTVAMASADVVYSPTYATLNPVVSLSYCSTGSPYAIFPIWDGEGPYPVEPTVFSGFSVVGQSQPTFGDLWVIELASQGAGTYQINYSDGVGCTGMFNWIVNEPVDLQTITVSGIGGSCSDGYTGTATVSVPFLVDDNDLHLAVKDAGGNVLYETECLGENPGGWPGATIPFTSLAPGDYWAVLDVDEYCLFDALPTFISTCIDSVMFTIPDLGVPCGEVIGTLFVDADGDCVLDANENTVPYTVIAITPGNSYTSTGSNGWFGTDAVAGANTFTEQHPILDQSCPGSVNVVAGTTQILDIGMAPDAPLDAMVSMGGSPMRPGMSASYWIQARNLTDAETGTVTLTVQLDPVLNYIDASPLPTSVVGGTITWTDPDFTMSTVFEQDNFYISVSLPPDPLLVGTVVSTIATLTSANSDADLSNNTITQNTTVTASLDPNDKIARTSTQQFDDVYLIDADEWIDYTIRFQNTGTDTAFNVVITDTLPTTLDPTSLMVGAASHGMSWTVSGPGILRFVFPDILLPDSTTNEAASHGLVTLRIKPHLPLTAGTVISNTANIYFDFNDPVITEPSVLVAEFSTGMEEAAVATPLLVPNPAIDHIRLVMRKATPLGFSWAILSTDGRVVSSGRSIASEETIEINALARGTYLARIISTDRTYTLPFIKTLAQ
ncbi:MAG: T9SS type A sorting domain-containing protein [Flavobacteriales bacterium]